MKKGGPKRGMNGGELFQISGVSSGLGNIIRLIRCNPVGETRIVQDTDALSRHETLAEERKDGHAHP